MLDKKIPPLLVWALAAGLIWFTAMALPTLALPFGLRLGAALLLVIPAAVLCLAGVVEFRRRGTTVDPRRPQAVSCLVTSGVYGISRNPMYAGFALALLAWTLYLASLPSLLVVAGFVFYLDRFQIQPEERALEKMFGAVFRAYRVRVRRWL